MWWRAGYGYAGCSGVRASVSHCRLRPGTYPEITEALAAQRAGDFIIDGEIVAFDDSQTSFARLQQRLGVRHPAPDLLAEVPVRYYVFDVLWADDRDVRPLPLRERKQILRDLLTFTGPLRFTEHKDTDGEAYFRQAYASGWEGVIAKRAHAPYHAGRSRDRLKFKCQSGQEFVIGGFTDPRGSRTGFGALLLGYCDPGHQLIYAGKVGTGFSQRTLDSLHATLADLEQDRPPFDRGKLPRSGVHWVQPRLVAEVGFSEWTTGIESAGMAPADLGIAGELAGGWLDGLLALLPDQLAPRRRRNRPGTVPDVRGLFYAVCLEVATRHGLHVSIVQLTEHPMAVDGLVVDQDPRPPTRAYRAASSRYSSGTRPPARADRFPAVLTTGSEPIGGSTDRADTLSRRWQPCR